MTLYVQYSNSSNFQDFLYGTDENIGLNNILNISWVDFYNDIFNILTANSVGLNLWGQILNTSRNYYLPISSRTFGFNVNPMNTTGYAQNFNNGTFYSGATWSTLPDGEYRCLLMLKARTFISNMSIASITKLLNDFFINLQQYGSDTQNYQFVVSVAVDNTQIHQLNYIFKDVSPTPTGLLPLWVGYIFSLSNLNTNTYYLPLPIGTIPNITITT